MENKDLFDLFYRGLSALINSNNQMNLAYITDEIKRECTIIERIETDNKIKQYLIKYSIKPLDQISVDMLKINLRYYCETMWIKIQNRHMEMQLPSYNAVIFLFSNNIYSKTDVLYKNNKYKLNVSKLLDVIAYGLSIANIIFDVDTEEYENCVMVLRGLSKLFNNEQPENLLKNMSYMLEVFYKIKNYFETNPKIKKKNKIKALSVCLFIEFLQK